MATDWGCTHALFLQGPTGPFFAWMIDELRSQGIQTTKVLLNRADDPAAIGAFRRLLEKHPDQQVRWDVAKALGTLWAGRQLEGARDALLEVGLADADPTVRRTCAAALGSSGPRKKSDPFHKGGDKYDPLNASL